MVPETRTPLAGLQQLQGLPAQAEIRREIRGPARRPSVYKSVLVQEAAASHLDRERMLTGSLRICKVPLGF